MGEQRDGLGVQMRQCRRCRGMGWIVVASHYVGDGAYNDDFDECPTCHGSGRVRERSTAP